jgi:hypothetical protein
VPHWSDVTVLSWVSVEQASPPLEGLVILFRGCGARSVREWVAQCHGADTGLTAQCCTVAGMALPGGGGTASGHDSQACQRCGTDSYLTGEPACVRTLKAPVGGAGTGVASS